MIPVVWLDAHPLCWDQHIVDDLLPASLFDHSAALGSVTDGAVLVVPARYHTPAEINDLTASWQWAVILLTSDEEGTFDWMALEGDRRRVWVQTPSGGAERMLPLGAPPADPLPLSIERELPWSFMGQVTHSRRRDCVEQLRDRHDGYLLETPGFTQGLDRRAYLETLAASKVAPCPSGPETVDTFRGWEALEAGCIPVLDARTPRELTDYWDRLLGGHPVPIVDLWADLPAVMDGLLDGWTAKANRVTAWFLQYKRNLRRRLWADIETVSERSLYAPQVTVMIPTSPIPSHPSTEVLEQTVESVRFHFPDADILLMCDGVRREQAHYRDRYDDYLQRVMLLCQRQWSNVTPLLQDVCRHQANMTRDALNQVDTPAVLFVEHDTPIVTDEPIEWDGLIRAVVTDEARIIRLHHEALVLEPHRRLMLDEKPRIVHGAPLLRTVQWSQRPHLASTGFYRQMIATYFGTANTMIEDVMHGKVEQAWQEFGLAGWDRFRLWMYSPQFNDNIKRSYHLDGRGDDPKYGAG